MDNNVVVVKDGAVALNEDFVAVYIGIKNQLKEWKELDEKYTAMIQEAMEQNSITKFDNEDVSITYVFPTEREDFDKKAFRAEHPDLYDDFVKLTKVKASVRVKVK